MRKILSMVLAVVMLAGCVLAFSSCGAKPELDMETVKTNLEGRYKVAIYEQADLVNEPWVERRLSAEKTVAGSLYNSEALTITVFTDSKIAKLYYKNAKAELDARIDSLKLDIKEYEHYVDECKKTVREYEEKIEKDEATLAATVMTDPVTGLSITELTYYQNLLNTAKNDLTVYEKTLSSKEDDLEYYNDVYVIGRKGDTVWVGTVGAIEASKWSDIQ